MYYSKITTKLSHFNYTWLSFHPLQQHFLPTTLEIAKGTLQWNWFSNLLIGSAQVLYSTKLLKAFAFAILASNSRRYWYSKLDSPLSTLYRESPTPRIGDTASPLQNFVYRKLSVSVIQRVVDYPYHWYGKSSAPRVIFSGPLYKGNPVTVSNLKGLKGGRRRSHWKPKTK